jgi:hypothetical protein
MRPRIFAAREARHENVLIPAIAAPQRVEFPNYHGSSVSAELLDALRTDENAQIKVADAVFTRLQEYLATRVQGFVADDWFEIHRLCECMHVLK